MHIEHRDVIYEELNLQERRAINILKENPRYFFSYAKKFSKLKTNIGPLRDKEGNLQHTPEAMAELLQAQYLSVFSDPSKANIQESMSSVPNADSSISSISFTAQNIVEAIDELDNYAATSDDDIPAKVIKNCKNHLSVPILYMI